MQVEELFEQSSDLAPMLAGQRAPDRCHEVDMGEDDSDDDEGGDGDNELKPCSKAWCATHNQDDSHKEIRCVQAG